MHRQVAAMPNPTVAADLDQPLDVHIDLTPEVALDLIVAVDEFTQPRDLFFGQVFHARIGTNARRRQHLLAAGRADAEDVRERDFHTLVAGNIYPGDSGHAPDPPRCLVNAAETLLNAAARVLQEYSRRLTSPLCRAWS